MADAGLVLQGCSQPGDHAGGAPEDHPEWDPDSPGPGDTNAWPRRAGVKQSLQRCRALTRRSRGGDSQPAPNRTKSLKPRGFGWDVGITGLLPSKVIPCGKRAGLPVPCAGEAKDSWDTRGVPRWMWLSLALFCKMSQTVMMPFHMVIRLTGWMDVCALS